jgi:glyoxylase-like metal-dependent hydrolase (beta-lactamase superfamily II)
VGGGERNEWAVIDPGPADDRHVDALIAAAPGRIRWIFTTDASSDTALLEARTGAQLRWPQAGDDGTLVLSSEITLRVVRDPDPASGRFGYLLVQEKTLFAGSLATDASSLRPLLHEELEWCAPVQGFLVAATP